MDNDNTFTSEQIVAALAELKKSEGADDKIILPFYKLLQQIAKSFFNANIKRKVVGDKYSPEDLAGDFFVHLSNTDISYIKTKNHLYRELKKYYGTKFYNAQRRVWNSISKILNELTKDNYCLKLASGKERKFNSNNTVFCMPGKENNQVYYDKVDKFMISYTSKDSLTPTEIRTLIEEILIKADGPIKLGEIKDYIFNKINFFNFSDNQDEEGKNLLNGLPDRSIVAIHKQSFDINVEQQIENRFTLLWDKIKTIRGGKSTVIEGLKVLCCYFLPKQVYGHKIILSELGPSSTVADINTKVECAFKYVFTEMDFEDKTKIDILKGVLEKLKQNCSEKYSLCHL